MALSTRFSVAARNKKIDAITPDLNNGYLRIYDGARPASPDVAITTQNLLAELRFNATAYGIAVNGVAAANAFTQDVAANATGVAVWFRALKSDGATAVIDGEVGMAGANLNLNVINIQAGAPVLVTSLPYAEPMQGV